MATRRTETAETESPWTRLEDEAAVSDYLDMLVEERRLRRVGKRRLAERIDHVSRTQGDGLGYDVLSFDDDGAERLIEVKTTRGGVSSPFFATRNEVEVSDAERARYHLYRVFAFDRKPQLFTLPGSLRTTCLLEPMQYRAEVA
jgi:hypothetical protein